MFQVRISDNIDFIDCKKLKNVFPIIQYEKLLLNVEQIASSFDQNQQGTLQKINLMNIKLDYIQEELANHQKAIQSKNTQAIEQLRKQYYTQQKKLQKVTTIAQHRILELKQNLNVQIEQLAQDINKEKRQKLKIMERLQRNLDQNILKIEEQHKEQSRKQKQYLKTIQQKIFEEIRKCHESLIKRKTNFEVYTKKNLQTLQSIENLLGQNIKSLIGKRKKYKKEFLELLENVMEKIHDNSQKSLD